MSGRDRAESLTRKASAGRGHKSLKKGGLTNVLQLLWSERIDSGQNRLPPFEPPRLDVFSGGNEDHAVSVI